MYANKALFANLAGDPTNSFAVSYLLDSATKKFDIAFIPTETITLAKVNFKATSLNGSPTCTIRIETDTSGRASGTLVGSLSATAHVVTSGWQTEVAFDAGATASITAGTLYHMVITNDAGTPGTNRFAVLDQTAIDYVSSTSGYTIIRASATQWTASYDGATWANRNGPVFVLVSNDGSPIYLGQPIDTDGLTTMSSTTTFYGIKFTAPVTGTIIGFWFASLVNGVPALTYQVYSGDTSLSTGTINTVEATIYGNTRNVAYVTLSTPVSVTAGSSYRLVIKDTTGTDRLEWFSAPSSPDYRTVNPVLQQAQWTQGTAGSGEAGWTDTSGKLPAPWGVVIDSVSAGGSGGNTILAGDGIGLVVRG